MAKKISSRRYVYLLFAPLMWKWKIGIANCTVRRRADIDKDVYGPVFKVFRAKVRNAPALERKLHRFYAKNRRPLRFAGRSAGRTEWFRLNPFDVLYVVLWLFWEATLKWVVLLSILAMIVYQYLK